MVLLVCLFLLSCIHQLTICLNSNFLCIRVATVQPSESVYMAAKKMRDFRVNSVIITTGNKPQGILTYVLFIVGLQMLIFFPLTNATWRGYVVFCFLLFSCWFFGIPETFMSIALQFKRFAYTGCCTKSFSRINPCWKGLVLTCTSENACNWWKRK